MRIFLINKTTDESFDTYIADAARRIGTYSNKVSDWGKDCNYMKFTTEAGVTWELYFNPVQIKQLKGFKLNSEFIKNK